ncbi:MAG TPA: nuclear transport factor 2 family protein [Parafilimonas sp.]|nr:nuclear transport factor 2 family protein [Parafilimonas sp.]
MKTNLEIVQEGYANFLQGNIPALMDTLSDNIEWELPASAHVNFSGVFKGKDAVMNFFRNVDNENTFSEFAVDSYVANGNYVIALGHLTATAKSTGKISSNKWAHLWQLEEGKVVKHYEYADTAEIRDAFSN